MHGFARRRPLAIVGGLLLATLGLCLFALAAFPVGRFKGLAERRLSARFGVPVTIGSLERRDRFSLRPTIEARGIVVPQPRWAARLAPAGDLLRIGEATFTLPLLPLLRVRIEPSAVAITGARVSLLRTADRATNWPRGGGRGSASPVERLTLRDVQVAYRDLYQGREALVTLAADPARGLVARGRGRVGGTPVSLAVDAPPGAGGHWPVSARIDGPALAMTATGSMAAPLDTGRMALDVTARARDLKLVDAIIEAGLFGTQPVRLAAHVEHDGARWRVTRLAGRIGASTALTGHLNVTKAGERTVLAGAVHATALDFNDLATDAGLAAARAKRAAIGDRLVPDTPIDLARIPRTDGELDVGVDRIVGREPSALRTLSGHLSLDRQRLTVFPLGIGLTRGAITGRVVVDQRGGPPLPLVRFDLRLAGSSVPAIAGGGGRTVTGRLDARALLKGRGGTIREAVGASSGRIGLAARDGALPARIADALGFDAGRALFAGGGERAGLRCAILGLAMRRGVGRADPMVIDTSASQLRGTGSVSFPSEAVALRLTGAPKRGSLLRLPGAAFMTGTIEDPQVVVPREVKSPGNFLRAIGRAITGRQDPTATDADCAALAARVLR